MDGQNFNNDVQNYTAPSQDGNNNTNVLAILSLVAGILSIIMACCVTWVGIILGIAGIILAIFANKQGKTGLATAGMICSIIGIVIAVLMIILVIILGVGLGLTGFNLG